MNYLCSNLNHTFVVLNLPKELTSIVNKNQLTGIFGSCTDKLLCKPELRKCKIIAEDELGKKYDNSSYSGVLGLLQTQKVDLYLKGESDLIDEDFFLKTYSIRSEKILAFHLISDSNRSYFDLINNFNFEILLYLTYICCNLFCFFFYLILYNLRINKIQLKKIKFNCFVSFFLIKKNKLNIINLFLLFMTLFYWFNQLLIRNQIKTNTVVIDKSDLIINQNDLFKTKRIVCFINEEVEYKMALKLSKNNILNRLLIEKTLFYEGFEAEIRAFNSPRCLFHRNTHAPLTGFVYSPKWIILAHETTRMIFITMFSDVISDFSFWTMSDPVYQFDVVLYYNLRNKININFKQYSLKGKFFDCFNKIFNFPNDLIKASESGLYKNVYSCFERNVKISTIRKVKLIDNLDELNENSKYKEFIRVEFKNQITGLIGRCFNEMLCKKVESRKCSIIEEQKLGIKYANGSYSDILGILQRNEADIYIKSESLINEPFLKATIPIQSEKIISGHMIFDGNATYFNLLNNFSFRIEIYLSYLISILFSFTFYLLLLNIDRIKLRKPFIYHCPLTILQSKKNKLSIINLFLNSLNLFFWFTIIIITMQIKTNKIVIDKSKFLTTEHDLLTTKKVACFIKNEVESQIAANLPERFTLSKIYHEKTKFKDEQIDEIKHYGKRCFFHFDTNPLLEFIFSNKWYTVGHTQSMMVGLFFFGRGNFKAKFWVYNHPLYEFNYHLHYTLRNKMNRLFSKDAQTYLEVGLFERLLSCVHLTIKLEIFESIKIFENLDDYAHDKSKGFENLILTNFKSIFIIYLIANLSILLIFIFNFIINQKNKLLIRSFFKF